MSDAIQYCKNCTSQVMCHMERKCMRQALGLSSAACSRWYFKFCRRSDSQTYRVSYKAFELMDAYAQFESDVDPDDVSWVEHSENDKD